MSSEAEGCDAEGCEVEGCKAPMRGKGCEADAFDEVCEGPRLSSRCSWGLLRVGTLV